MNEAMVITVYGDDDLVLHSCGSEEEMRKVFTKLVTEDDEEADSFFLVKVLASAETELRVTEHC